MPAVRRRGMPSPTREFMFAAGLLSSPKIGIEFGIRIGICDWIGRGMSSPTREFMFAAGLLSSPRQFLRRSADKHRMPKMLVIRLGRAMWCEMRKSSEERKSLESKRTRRKMIGSTGNWTEMPKFCLQPRSRRTILWMLKYRSRPKTVIQEKLLMKTK